MFSGGIKRDQWYENSLIPVNMCRSGEEIKNNINKLQDTSYAC